MNRIPSQPRLWLAAAAVALAALTWLPHADAGNAPIRLTVRVPADATLSIDGHKTNQRGTERVFESPAVAPGKAYTYTLVATWPEGGAPKSAERKVKVEAGGNYTVDFTKPEANGKDPEKKDPEKKDPEKKDPEEKKAGTPKVREFLFTYGATITGLKPGETARVWLPVPQTTEDQDIKIATQKLPAKPEIGTEPKYGNKVLYFQAKADDSGTIPMSVTYRVKRNEVVGQLRRNKLSEEDAKLFLKADKMVPIGGRPQELIKGKTVPEDPMAAAKAFYDAVNEFMTYDKKGKGWGQGDVDWICDNKYGNCTDFHSMFISLARTGKIPAKFEMGFPIPTERGKGEVGGYHCWAMFSPDGKHWIPVDISEANRAKEKNPKMVQYYFGNLTEDRVTFTAGRDINLVPKQAGEPLNYFIYPYAEVDGRAVALDNIKRTYSYQDVSGE